MRYSRIVASVVLQFFLVLSLTPPSTALDNHRHTLRTQPLIVRGGSASQVLQDLRGEAYTLGPLTREVVGKIHSTLTPFNLEQPLSDAEQSHLADAFEAIFRNEVLPNAEKILKETGIEEIVVQKQRKGAAIRPTDYPRVVIHLDPQRRFELTIIGYLPGQRNPIHNHGGNVCVFCILGKGTGKEKRFKVVEAETAAPVRLRETGEEPLKEGDLSKITRRVNPIHQVINDGTEILYEVAIYADPLVVGGVDVYRPLPDGTFQVVRHIPSAGGHSFESGVTTSRDGGNKTFPERLRSTAEFRAIEARPVLGDADLARLIVTLASLDQYEASLRHELQVALMQYFKVRSPHALVRVYGMARLLNGEKPETDPLDYHRVVEEYHGSQNEAIARRKKVWKVEEATHAPVWIRVQREQGKKEGPLLSPFEFRRMAQLNRLFDLPVSPLVESNLLSSRHGRHIYRKLEPVLGSQKARLASYIYSEIIQRIREGHKVTHLITASTGNQAIAVAEAGLMMKKLFPEDLKEMKIVVYVAKNIVPEKEVRLRELGVIVRKQDELHEEGEGLTTYEAAKRLGSFLSSQEPDHRIFVPHGTEVIPSFGTIGLEIVEQLKAQGVDPTREKIAVIVPIGSGGMAVGIERALAAFGVDAMMIGVQTPGANSMVQSLFQNETVNLGSKVVATLADGIAVSTPEVDIELVRKRFDIVAAIEEEDVLRAAYEMHREGRAHEDPLLREAHKGELAAALPDAFLANYDYLIPLDIHHVVMIATGKAKGARIENWLTEVGNILDQKLPRPQEDAQLQGLAARLLAESARDGGTKGVSLWAELDRLKKEWLRHNFVSLEFNFAEVSKIKVAYETREIRGRGNPEALIITAPHDATASEIMHAVATVEYVDWNRGPSRLLPDDTKGAFVQLAKRYGIPLDASTFYSSDPPDKILHRLIAGFKSDHPGMVGLLERPDVLALTETFFHDKNLGIPSVVKRLRAFPENTYRRRFQENVNPLETVDVSIEDAGAFFKEIALLRDTLYGGGVSPDGGDREVRLAKAEAAVRRSVIGGNWKMAVNTVAEAHALLEKIAVLLESMEGIDVFVAPSFVHLPEVRHARNLLQARSGLASQIHLAAQDVSSGEPGAYTGQVSYEQLKDLGVEYVIIGHSERRHGELQGIAESSEIVNKKVKLALANGLKPIVAVGETLDEREAGATETTIEDQIRKSLSDVTPEQMKGVVIAYEPVWAIGTGKTATSQEANNMQRFIRGVLLTTFGDEVAAQTRIQYGGGVNPKNIAELIAQPNIDGGLIGGASLNADQFTAIVKSVSAFARTQNASDGGEKGVSLAEAVASIVEGAGEEVTLSKMFEARPFLDELGKTDEAGRAAMRTLYTVLVRELFSRLNQKLHPDRTPMPVAEDIYPLEIGSRMSRVNRSTILVLSAERLLDETLKSNPDVLSDLLKETEGFLYFSTPELSTAEARWFLPKLRNLYGYHLAEKITRRFISRLDQLPETSSVVFLLNPDDPLAQTHAFQGERLLAPLTVNHQRAFVVPLKAPVDLLKEVYLGTSLASQFASLGENRLEDLDAATKLLLAEVTEGFGKAGKLITSEKVQNELAEAKRIATVVLQGL